MNNRNNVKDKVNKMLSKPTKRMKKLLSNKRKGYAKLIVKHETKNAISNLDDYYDEALEDEIDLNYGMNESYHYADDPEPNTTDMTHTATTLTMNPPHSVIRPPRATKTSVTQTFIDDVLDRGTSRHTEYCVLPLYLMIFMISLLTTALLSFHEISLGLGMAILCGFSFVGALMGMYGVYAWGIFDDTLSYLQKQNQQYELNIDHLNSMGEVLQNDVDDISHSVDYLRRDGNVLEHTMHAYDKLKSELEAICDTMDGKENGGETMMQLLDALTDQHSTLNTIVEDNEMAHLLSMFYSVKVYDYGMDNRLDRKQYKKFLAYCNKDTRQRFEDEGGFDAMDVNQTGFIDVNHFEQMVRKLIHDSNAQSQHTLDSTIKVHQEL